LIEKPRAEPRRRKEGAPAPKPDKGGVLASYGLSTEQGQEIIMAARQAAGWFADEEA
jgi:N utilization substance protein A